MKASLSSSLSSPMWMLSSCCLLLLLMSSCTLPVAGIDLSLFYPFGPLENDMVLRPGDESSSDEIHLDENFVVYNQSFKSVYVNTNGHVSFDSEVPAYRAHIAMPLGAYLVAAFYADIDTRGSGRVYYRNTSTPAVLQRAAADVQSHFTGFQNFMPKSLFIATWDRVGYYDEKSDKVNTFQIVLTTDGANTFAFFHYLDNGIQWKQSDGKFVPTYPDIPPQAGFEGGKDGPNFLLDKSGVSGDFVMGSNINMPGAWMYRVGPIETGNVVPADLNSNTRDEQIFLPEMAAKGCLQAGEVCSPNAECTEHAKGFCCACAPPYYGNGYECLEPDRAQKLNGRVIGSINGYPLDDDHYMHTYVETKDGRTHSSISKVPAAIAPGLQILNSIGGIVGWLFAMRTGSTSSNGFEYTGGRFNRTARVTFQTSNRTDQVLRIYQTFQGFATPNNLRMETRIDGNMPELPADAKVEVEDYSEVYEKTGRGIIRSFAQRVYRVNGAPYRYTWENTISFEECDDGRPQEAQDKMRVEVSRIYFNYDLAQMAYRFGMWSRVVRSMDNDPCATDVQNCDTNADCERERDSFRCTCKSGFSGNGVTCEDDDECLRSPCDVNARCYNTPGNFQCQCLTGFSGNGRTCQRDVQLCGTSICDDNARCVFVDDASPPVCQCNAGYRGDGQRCVAGEYDCREVNVCGDNARCMYDDILREYSCECLDEFSGDGYTCERVDQGCDACHHYAECNLDPMRNRYTCRCREGYTGDGRTCSVIETCGRCDRYARCFFNEQTSVYQCACVRGYEGDGQTCTRVDCRNYEGLCAEEGGLCWTDPATDFGICRCNYGYRGDGFRCDRLSCDVYNFCDRNAKCVSQEDGFDCQCNEGFVGDGRRCRQSATTCDVFNDCDRNARCLPDPAAPATYSCQCNPGFRGDGKQCALEPRVSCNQVNNCHNRAECMYDPDDMSYRCVCGRGFEGDGFDCRRRDVVDCRRDQRMCSPNAECVRSTDDTYACVCSPGYRGDGATCSTVTREGEYLVYAQGNKLMRVSTDPQPGDYGQQLAYIPGQLAVGIDNDCDKGHLYWTDAAHGVIRRSRMDGSEVETILSGLKSPEGIAIDFSAGNMFFTDSEMDVLQVAKLDGTEVRTVVDVDMFNPRAIVLDINKGTIYWTDWNRHRPQIERINMDGTDRRVFVNDNLRLPNGLTFDTYSQQLCWCDAGSQTIECIRTDGTGRRIIYDGTSHPFDITILNNAIYWTDWKRRNIPSVNKNGENPNDPLPLAVGGHGRLYGITAVRDQCPRVRNSCALNNGGCSFLCLPSPNGGRTCACPDGVDPRICQQ